MQSVRDSEPRRCTDLGKASRLAQGKPNFVRHTLNADTAGDIGLSCGGTVDLFLEPVVPSTEMAALCEAVATGITQRLPVQVFTGLEWNGGPAFTS